MSEAQHKAQGIVGISLMVQIGDTPNPELRIITSTFNKVLYKGKYASVALKEKLSQTLEFSNYNFLSYYVQADVVSLSCSATFHSFGNANFVWTFEYCKLPRFARKMCCMCVYLLLSRGSRKHNAKPWMFVDFESLADEKGNVYFMHKFNYAFIHFFPSQVLPLK